MGTGEDVDGSLGTMDEVEADAGATDGIAPVDDPSGRALAQTHPPTVVTASSHPTASATVGPRGVSERVSGDRICK